MNRSTRTRQFARLSAIIGTGVVTFGFAGSARAETPEEPIDVVDAPECTPWSHDGLTWHYADEGNNSLMFQVGFWDGIETCDEMVTLDIYTLASPTAQIDDPGSSLYFAGGYMLSVVEDATEQFGVHDWAASAPGECSEFRFEIGGELVSLQRVIDDCDLPIAADDPDSPDPVDPENPDDFVDGDGGQPDNPDDFDSGTPQGDQPDDGGAGQGGELPSTGTASSLLVLLAGTLTTLGGFVVAGARRREV